MSETVNTKQAAEACDTTPRLLRQFLRASKDYQAVGSGGRYAFEADELDTLKTRFDAWVAEREAAAKARAEAEKAAQASKTTGDEKAEPTNVQPTEEKAPAAKPARGRKPAAA